VHFEPCLGSEGMRLLVLCDLICVCYREVLAGWLGAACSVCPWVVACLWCYLPTESYGTLVRTARKACCCLAWWFKLHGIRATNGESLSPV
jgi:hypothetical protein